MQPGETTFLMVLWYVHVEAARGAKRRTAKSTKKLTARKAKKLEWLLKGCDQSGAKFLSSVETQPLTNPKK